MNDFLINDMNKKLEELTKRCDLLEKTNDSYKQTIELNKTNILILNKQQEALREEYKKKINDLKDYFNNQFQQLLQIITPNPKNANKNNEIIFVNQNKNTNDIKNIYDEVILTVEKKLEEFRYEIYLYLGKTTKKDSNEKNIIFDNKNANIKDRFENKLFNIILDEKQKIPTKDLNELKKLGTALLIEKKQNPLNYSKNFIEQNINNENIDEMTRIKIGFKQSYIFKEMEEININEIKTFNRNEFIKQFREKYGIESEDINENELIKEMEDNNYSEINIIEAILKKLEYIK